MKFFVQAEISADNWVNQPHGLPTKSIEHDRIFRDSGWVDEEGKCTGYLSFPDAHESFGGQKQYDLNIGLEAGKYPGSSLWWRFRGQTSGRVRFQIVIDGLEKLPSDWEWIWATFDPEKGKEDRKVGVRVKDLEWRWSYDEAPLRNISVETNPDQTKKITITIGPYTYIKNTWLFVYPDTWGPGQVSTTNDDCCESNVILYMATGFDSDGNWIGQNSKNSATGWYAGVRFQNITVPQGATIGDGCFIDGYQKYPGGTGLSENVWTAQDIDDSEDFNTTAPRDMTLTTAEVALDFDSFPTDEQWWSKDDSAIFCPEIKTIVQEIVDRENWASGNAMSFVCKGDAGSTDRRIQFQDYGNNASQAPKLTIVYTAAGETIQIALDNIVYAEQDLTVLNPESVLIALDNIVYAENDLTANIAETISIALDNIVYTELGIVGNSKSKILVALDNIVYAENTLVVNAKTQVAIALDNIVYAEQNLNTNAKSNIPIALDNVVYTEQDLFVLAAEKITIALDNIVYEENDLTINATAVIQIAKDDIVYTEQNLNTNASSIITVTLDNIVYAEQDLNVKADESIVVTRDNIVYSGNNILVQEAGIIQIGVGSYVYAEGDLNLNDAESITIALDNIVYAEGNVLGNAKTQIAIPSDNIVFTEQGLFVNETVLISADDIVYSGKAVTGTTPGLGGSSIHYFLWW